MFGLRKKQKSKKNGEAAGNEPATQITEQVHVMPERFYVAPKKKRTGLILIIVLGVVLIGGLITAGYFLNQGLLSGGELPPPDTNQAAINLNQGGNNSNTNQPVVNENQNVNADLNINVELPTTTPTTTPTSTDSQIINTNINTNTNVNNNVSPVSPAPDIDGDGLTAAEEILYGTDSVNRDTDGDGYSDGSEIISGYDPRQAGKSSADSDLFSRYQSLSYIISYPSRWRLRELAAAQTEVIFQSTSGEFVEVLILPNSKNLALTQWYQQQFPGSAAEQLTAVKINNLDGFLAADNLNYYLINPVDPGQVYLITYNTGDASQANFLTTFNVMVKSFKLVP